MRTTVTLDPDVEILLRSAVRDTGAPFKQVLNNALRDGLLGRGSAARAAEPTAARYGQPVFAMGAAHVDASRAGALADVLEDAALIAKLQQGR